MRFVRGTVAAMGRHRTVRALRRPAAALCTAVLLVAGVSAATPAAAATTPAEDEPSRQGGATATLEGLKTYGQAVVHEDGEELTTGAGLFEMAVDGGGRLQTYGLDVDNPTQQHARYGETDWARTSLHDNPDAGKIVWILRHSYPQVDDLNALAKRARSGKLSPETAAAGTQVAVWRFTDGRGARPDRGKGGGLRVSAVDPAAEKLADHLERSARKLAQPRPSLSLDPAVLSRRNGRLGPFTVRTSASGAAVSQTPGSASPGARIVDRNGRQVTSVRDGARLYLDVPEARRQAGKGSLTVQAATKVAVGRAFTGVGGHAASQAQILAGSSRSTVTASATVDWAESGAIPAVETAKSCARGGVLLTVSNSGDRAFRFRLAGGEHAVAAGGHRTYTVPVREDQAYRIPLTGPRGTTKSFSGVLDCATRSAVPVAAAEDDGEAPQLRTATVGGGSGKGAGGDLAETGASGTPMIAGTAVGLVVLGAMAVLVVRRKNPDDEGVHAD
ncbi:TQXA domain-containing protein [Streptomyces sp. Amel2xB2]|uniref:thioester domain-containing protein n=1 Tax=Streptomyces sp. Amel2xB2 TaxID=1305829 RepID=UPI000DBFD372|nr:thioester domain-containing protein [Streptomyces sp. Amel2xB2]RAJ69926.1 TQXA domain-containing protein [Streptomyces sp. Amel2xB2]